VRGVLNYATALFDRSTIEAWLAHWQQLLHTITQDERILVGVQHARASGVHTAPATAAYAPPATPSEALIADAFAEVLRLERVGRDDDFFRAGGHSLLALQLLARLRRDGVHADIRALFSTPTPAGLAASVHQRHDVEVPPSLIPPDAAEITPAMLPLVSLDAAEVDAIVATVSGGARNVQDIYPVTPLQEGIHFHHLLDPTADAYVAPTLLAFDDHAQCDAFVDALQLVVDRHDVLRTAIVPTAAGVPLQVVWRRAPLHVADVEPMSHAQLLAQHGHTRIDLAHAPLLRLVRCGEADGTRALLLVQAHHIVLDHTTLQIVVEEVRAIMEGRADSLPEPVPFRRFVAESRLAVDDAEHEAFFRGMLADVDWPTVALGMADVHTLHALAEGRQAVDEELCTRLRAVARTHAVSAATVLHVAWARVVAALSGRDDVVFGSVLLGRMHGSAGVERAPGLFINTLPLRVRVADGSAAEVLRSVHDSLSGLLRHEHAPLALAQRCSALPASAPLFGTLFNYRHTDGAAEPWPGLEVLHSEERTHYPLSLAVDDLGERLVLTVHTREGVEPHTICSYVETAIDTVVAALEQGSPLPLATLPLMLDPQHAALVAGAAPRAHAPTLTAAAPYQPPGTPTETLIADAFAEVLRLERVGRDDDFFAAGGHSLLALRLLGRLRRDGVHVDVRALFKTPTPAGLAATAQHRREIDVPPPLIPPDADVITPAMLPLVSLDSADIDAIVATVHGGARNVQDIYPVTPLQEGIHFHYLLDPAADAYAAPTLLAFDSSAQRDAFVSALQLIIDRHDVLRTAIVPTRAGVPLQVVWRRAPLHVTDAAPMAHGSLLAEYGHTRIDLAHAPLLHVVRCDEVGTSRALLLVQSHHIVLDHTTLQVLVGEVRAAMEGRLDTLPAPVPFRRFVAESRLAVSQFEHEAFFRAMLADVDWPTSALAISELHSLQAITEATRAVDDALCTRLRAVARAHAVSTATLLHVAWARVVAALSGREDVVFGTVLLGRMQGSAGVEHALGLFINTLPLRVRIGASGAAEVVRTVHASLSELMRHEHAPLALAQRCSALPANVPLLGTLFNYRHGDGATEPWPGLEVLHSEERTHYPLSLAVDDLGERLMLTVHTREGADPHDVCNYVAAAAAALVDALEHTPQRPLTAIPLALQPEHEARARARPAAVPAPTASRQDAGEPRGALEQVVAAAFSAVLGASAVRRGESFFDLGGHSLLAIRLVQELVRGGLDVTLGDVFAHPTVIGLAAHLGRDGVDLHDRAVPLRAGGSRVPLFLVHEISGEVLYGPRLVKHLPAGFPVYGLLAEPYGDAPPRTLYAAAARLRRQVQAVQPAGPYRLAGWSLGGALAYEIATQLIADGATVEFVGLFDSFAAGPPPEALMRSDTDLLFDTLLMLQRLTHADADADFTAYEATIAHMRSGLADVPAAAVLERAYADGLVAADWPASFLLGTVRRLRVYGRAAAAWQPLPLPVDVHLFRARGSSDHGWERVVESRRLLVHDVAGDHLGMMNEPHVAVLGDAVAAALALPAASAPKPRRPDALVTIQRGAAEQPVVVCVPGAGASVFSFAPFAQSLGGTYAVYGLQPKGLDGGALPHATVEAAAHAYVQELQQRLPDVPLHLVGHSFGGWVAFEMALRLRAAGRTPAGLILVDSEPPTGHHTAMREYDDVEVMVELIDVLGQSAGRPLDVDPAGLRNIDHAARLVRLHTEVVRAGLLPAGSDPTVLGDVFRTFAAALRTHYEPAATYPGAIELVLPDPAWLGNTATLGGHARTTARWRRCAPALVVSYLDANHMTVLEAPHVEEIARSVQLGIGRGARQFSHAAAITLV